MNGSNQGRRNWTLSISVAFLLAAAAAAIGSLADGGKQDTDRLYLKNTAGPVLFDHGKHQQLADSCAVCHHDLLGAAQATPCSQCHGDDVVQDDFPHAELKELHGGQCVACHAQVQQDDRAVSCRSCHAAGEEVENEGVGCGRCHDDEYSADLVAHDELAAIEDHSCLDCHQPVAIAQIFHSSCTACHLESGSPKFADADGGAVCGVCHLP